MDILFNYGMMFGLGTPQWRCSSQILLQSVPNLSSMWNSHMEGEVGTFSSGGVYLEKKILEWEWMV